MRVFQTKWFRRFALRKDISDDVICNAIKRAERGLIDADLGRGLIKQRVARPGFGSRGGFRTIVVYRKRQRAFFVFGFAKSDQATLDAIDLKTYEELAGILLRLNGAEITRAIAKGELFEVRCHDDQEGQVP